MGVKSNWFTEISTILLIRYSKTHSPYFIVWISKMNTTIVTTILGIAFVLIERYNNTQSSLLWHLDYLKYNIKNVRQPSYTNLYHYHTSIKISSRSVDLPLRIMYTDAFTSYKVIFRLRPTSTSIWWMCFCSRVMFYFCLY